MAIADIDFEGNDVTTTTVDNHDGNDTPPNQKEGVESLDGDDDDDITGKDNNQKDDKDNSDNKDDNDKDDNSSTGELEAGTVIEFDGANYTVDANGNLVDDKGNVFKESKDVKAWMDSLEVDTDDKTLSLALIQEGVGVTITDGDGNPVEFTDDIEGVNSYISSVIDLKSEELQQAAINKLYADNPLLKQFNDYVTLTGTPRGFGEIPDRSGITLDKDDESQLVAVIRMAAQEFGNKSLNDNYIKYLKDSGGLFDEAKNQLKALVEKDKEYQEYIATEAQRRQDEQIQKENDYWNKVSNVIQGRVISGYKLPESFTKEVNGKKLVLTPNDFFKYLNKHTEVDDNGNKITPYMKDLSKLSDDDYLNRELLSAWLLFTGGDYKDLISMAVKEDAVRKLKVKSAQQRATKTIKIVKKQTGKVNIDDIVF